MTVAESGRAQAPQAAVPRPPTGLGIALVLLVLGAPQASACGWWWACAGRPYADRPAPRAYGYRSRPRTYRYRPPAWAYGYSSPARAYGDAYAAWPSTAIPPSPWYTETALQGPNMGAVGLTAPIASAQGLLESGLPARGPSLFGPNPPPSARGYAYGSPAYGYNVPSHRAPPSDTPSWWLEPRRRR